DDPKPIFAPLPAGKKIEERLANLGAFHNNSATTQKVWGNTDKRSGDYTMRRLHPKHGVAVKRHYRVIFATSDYCGDLAST
ncbi:MAG TPA: hypothetical protein PKH01_03805, partial [Pseudomonadales bacterium]|nr:hypothetical protein [Pseudomonadales bacterium]